MPSFFKRIGEWLDWVNRLWVVPSIFIAIGGQQAVKKLLGYFHRIPSDWASIIAWFAAAGIFVVLMVLAPKLFRAVPSSVPQSNQSQPLATGSFPSISALVPGVPKPQFDAQTFFKSAHYSPLTAEMEKNILIIANEKEPQNPVGFLARFIGVGAVAVLHDQTWLTIYKSQLLMLQDMNKKLGFLPLAEAKTYYDQAAALYPDVYAKYSFEQWLAYIKGQALILQHPSNMLEITFRGRDFLTYLTHWGRYPDTKKY